MHTSASSIQTTSTAKGLLICVIQENIPARFLLDLMYLKSTCTSFASHTGHSHEPATTRGDALTRNAVQRSDPRRAGQAEGGAGIPHQSRNQVFCSNMNAPTDRRAPGPLPRQWGIPGRFLDWSRQLRGAAGRRASRAVVRPLAQPLTPHPCAARGWTGRRFKAPGGGHYTDFAASSYHFP